jgi:hypothetical protein
VDIEHKVGILDEIHPKPQRETAGGKDARKR